MNFPLSRLLPWSLPVVLVAAYAWSASAATGASVGAVETVQGHGWGISASGGKYDKLGGDLVAMDEVVATGVHSAMTMRFIDNTTMTLGPNAEITVDDMVYNPDDKSNDTVVIKLGVGSFYFVSGLVAKEKVTILTPTASIGIRGTELVIDVREDGSTSVGVAKGHAYMRARDGSGPTVEVEVGSTAATDVSGAVSAPFPGIDLTGDDEVDHMIPGVSDWLSDDQHKVGEEDFTEFSNNMREGDLEIGDGEDGRKEQEFSDRENEPGDDVARTGNETDKDEVDNGRSRDGGEGDGGGEGGEGDGGGEGGEGGDGGGEGGDGGGEGGDGGGEGGDGGGEGGDGGGEGGDGDGGDSGDGGRERSK